MEIVHFWDDRSGKNSSNSYSSENLQIAEPEINQDEQFLHEIRNPLTNIEMCVMMLKSNADAFDTEIYLNIISRSATAINNVIRNKSGTLHYNGSKCSLNKLLDAALERAQDRITLSGVKVEKNYAPDLHDLTIDKTATENVFANIMINAVEAIQSKNGLLTITTKFDNDKNIVIIEDNGIGMNKENVKKIFDPYYTSKTNGLGLGLATTLAVLKSDHASLIVESAENEGTRFIISFDTAI